MIISALMNTVATIMTTLFDMINTLFPHLNLGNTLVSNITNVLEISNQAINFVHFIVGDTLAIIIPLATAILGYKYLLYPVVDFLRRLIPFVNL